MRRGLKRGIGCDVHQIAIPPRARPPMRRGLKHRTSPLGAGIPLFAARAAPYEKGTETGQGNQGNQGNRGQPRARPPMRRGLKRRGPGAGDGRGTAARAAPYEKGTETRNVVCRPLYVVWPRARPPMRRGLKR